MNKINNCHALQYNKYNTTQHNTTQHNTTDIRIETQRIPSFEFRVILFWDKTHIIIIFHRSLSVSTVFAKFKLSNSLIRFTHSDIYIVIQRIKDQNIQYVIIFDVAILTFKKRHYLLFRELFRFHVDNNYIDRLTVATLIFVAPFNL